MKKRPIESMTPSGVFLFRGIRSIGTPGTRSRAASQASDLAERQTWLSVRLGRASDLLWGYNLGPLSRPFPLSPLDQSRASDFPDKRSAIRMAASRLFGCAMPLPAMSKAVPWSGLVRTNGSPTVRFTPSSTPRYFTGISP